MNPTTKLRSVPSPKSTTKLQSQPLKPTPNFNPTTETHHQTSIQPPTITDLATEQSWNPSPIDPNFDLCHYQNSTTDADHHKPTPSTTPIHKLRPPPRRSPQTHALHLITASRQHHMHRNPQKKCQRERPIDLREEIEAYGFGFWFEQNQEIKRVQEG